MFDEPTIEPAKKYIIFTNHDDMNAWIAVVDNTLGYPEPLDKLIQTGAGIHGDPEIGRAQHFAEPLPNADGTKWALPFTDATTLPATAEAVEELPTDWYPQLP